MNIGQKIRGVLSSVFPRHTQAEDKTDWDPYFKAGTPEKLKKLLEQKRQQEAKAGTNALRRDAGGQRPWQNPQPTPGRHW